MGTIRIDMLSKFTALGGPLLQIEEEALQRAGIVYLQLPIGIRTWVETEKLTEAKEILNATFAFR